MIRAFFRNLSLRKKFLLVCLAVGFAPMILLGSFCSRQIKSILIDREKMNLKETLASESNMLAARFDKYTQAADYICWNANLKKALRQKYKSNMDMYYFYRDTLDPLLGSTKMLNSDIDSITVYTNVSIYPHGNLLRPLEDIEGLPWYDETANYYNHWIVSVKEQTVSLVSRIYDLPTDCIAIVKLNFDYADVFSSLQHLYQESYGVCLVDERGEILYRFWTEDISGGTLFSQQLEAENSITDRYVVEKVSGICDGWTLCLYRPIEMILTPIEEFSIPILLVCLLSAACILVISTFLSAHMVRPLEELTANIQRIEEGELICTVSYDSGDEIGCLTRKFEDLVGRLKHLIEDLLEEKIVQKEYEMRVLQAQINPHFLYNCLSLINRKAILTDQVEIGKMAQFLATFYRTTLNGGKSVTKVGKELENVRSYIDIQLLMHADSFDVSYRISEELLGFSMPNLLLQPLVENAILHGIDCLEKPKRGLLEITGEMEDEVIVFRISDNGPGIPASRLKDILSIGLDGGYGVKNVHQRVQLVCGSGYGLTYESEPGQGTTAILTLPQMP